MSSDTGAKSPSGSPDRTRSNDRERNKQPAAEEESEEDVRVPRGVDPHFDLAKLAPNRVNTQKLHALYEQRAALAASKKTMTKELKKVKRAKDRLKKKATSLSQDDLCQIIALKQDLSEQWKAKRAQASASSKGGTGDA